MYSTSLVEIVRVVAGHGKVLLAVRVLAGQPHVGRLFRSDVNDAAWHVRSLSFGSPAAKEANVIELVVEPLRGDSFPMQGQTYQSVEALSGRASPSRWVVGDPFAPTLSEVFS